MDHEGWPRKTRLGGAEQGEPKDMLISDLLEETERPKGESCLECVVRIQIKGRARFWGLYILKWRSCTATGFMLNNNHATSYYILRAPCDGNRLSESSPRSWKESGVGRPKVGE
jgi:hypothetical protein